MKKTNYFVIIAFFLLVFSILISPIQAEDFNKKNLIGKWEGEIIVNDQKLRIIINFSEVNKDIKGTITIPDQNIVDYRLNEIRYKDNNVYFELPAEEKGKFSGKFSTQEIVGDYIQKNSKGRFHLIKEEKLLKEEERKEEKISNKKRNKEDNKTINTKINEIEEEPDNNAPYPALLIFSDFGKVDKKKMQTYQMLKNIYLEHGYAVFHYKNNDFNFSKNINKNDFDYDQLVNQAINYIQNKYNNPNYNEIHILAESQGALLALAAFEKTQINIESFILLDPPTSSASKIILEQLSGLQNDLFAETRYIVNSLENGEKVQNVSSELETFFSPKIQPFLISWFNYEPLKLIKNNKKPILIIEKNSKRMPDSIIKRNNINYLLIENKIFNKEEKTKSIFLNDKFQEKIENFINDL